MAISEAEKNANVSKIIMEQKLTEKESTRKQQEIENQIYMAREKSLADADFYRWNFHFLFSWKDMDIILQQWLMVSLFLLF